MIATSFIDYLKQKIIKFHLYSTREINKNNMVKAKREYVFASCILAGIATVLSLIALGTQQWVVSELELIKETAEISNINYGLFLGTFQQNFGGTTYYEIEATCSFSNNVCAYLCGSNSDVRNEQLKALYEGRNVSWDQNCPRVTRTQQIFPRFDKVKPRSSDHTFLSAGIWLCTVLFLIISIVFGALSSGLGLWNTISNPVEVVFSVTGLYFYNAIASLMSLLTIILWGAFFSTTLIDDISFFYTLNGQMNSKGLASLGFSYWILMPTFVLYGINIFILYLRQYLINQEPELRVHINNNNDPGLYIY